MNLRGKGRPLLGQRMLKEHRSGFLQIFKGMLELLAKAIMRLITTMKEPAYERQVADKIRTNDRYSARKVVYRREEASKKFGYG